MELGWLDVCIRASNVEESIDFYKKLGFRVVDGNAGEGWAILVKGEKRIGLFEPRFMTTSFSLNFRGGNIQAIADSLSASGIEFSSEPRIRDNGSGSFEIRDPDGNLIFFDSAPNEVKPE